MNRAKEFVEKYKYPLIAFIFGIILLLLPASSGKEATAETEDVLLQQILSTAKGIGDVRVISSDKGVLISCEGADKAEVRLDIIKAVASYTGFGSDKIVILKMVK